MRRPAPQYAGTHRAISAPRVRGIHHGFAPLLNEAAGLEDAGKSGGHILSRLSRLLAIAFCESFATMLIERGIYFFAHERLAFDDVENLALALGFGGAYVVGALSSHAAARRLSEKRLLLLALSGQAAAFVVLCVLHGPYAVAILNVFIGYLVGTKWPLVESYVSAGRTPRDQVRTVGRFNLAWAGAIPPCLAVAGPLIAWRPEGLFLAGLGLTAVSLVLALTLARRPVHLRADHPERPTPGQMQRLRGLLAASRWSMLSGYSLLWILAALLPGVFDDLGVPVTVATALAGLLDVFRLAAFGCLQVWTGWHGRAWPLALVVAGLPAGFFLAVSAAALPVVLAGELVFGFSAGMTYFASLYYGMVVKNAAVEAGGAHEGLIGGGFALGPCIGLVGRKLAPVLGGAVVGMAAGVGPLLAVCSAGAAASLLKVLRADGREPPDPEREE